VIRIYY